MRRPNRRWLCWPANNSDNYSCLGLGGVPLAQPVSALQGRNVIAQGEALGAVAQTSPALKGRHKGRLRLCRPFRAEVPWTHDTQGVALGYNMTAFQAWDYGP